MAWLGKAWQGMETGGPTRTPGRNKHQNATEGNRDDGDDEMTDEWHDIRTVVEHPASVTCMCGTRFDADCVDDARADHRRHVRAHQTAEACEVMDRHMPDIRRKLAEAQQRKGTT